VGASIAVLALGVGGVAVGQPVFGDSGTAASDATFRVYQMNMCGWGSKYYSFDAHGDKVHSCFPNSEISKADRNCTRPACRTEERAEAGRKRQSMIAQVKRWKPAAVTVNEACRQDVLDVAKATGYVERSFGVGAGTRPSTQHRQCSEDRGPAVNAVLAKDFQGDKEAYGYFEAKPVPGNPYSHTRSYVCALVKHEGTGTDGVTRVCTGHLALSSPANAGRLQKQQCGTVQRILRSPKGGYPSVFAGDTNMRHMRCGLNDGFYGLQDFETKAGDQTPQSGLQHLYYEDAYTRGRSCGQMHKVEHTDHKGFLLDLHPTDKPSRGSACTWRDVEHS